MKAEVESRSLTAKRALKKLVLGALGNEYCAACGFRGRFRQRPALWEGLISEWGLSAEWGRRFDEREGRYCPMCYSNLRSCHLAETLVSALKAIAEAKGGTLREVLRESKVRQLQIAEINGAGTLHPFLKDCPNLKYSEYGSTRADVPSEDLLNLSYCDESFDLVITSETLEHVPNVDLALREIHRVLKVNGAHVFTVPIVLEQERTRQRAEMLEGKVVHRLPPSYHGGAGTNMSDFLVFYEFGGDFVQRCRNAGFSVRVTQDKRNPALVGLIATKQ